MDDTLCDTQAANRQAIALLDGFVGCEYGVHGQTFAREYVRGIYRNWTPEEHRKYLPIAQESERGFRVVLIKDLMVQLGGGDITDEAAEIIQDKFDADRISAFDFFPGITSLLRQLAGRVVQVVITNGPAFSQLPKLERVSLSSWVDHVIVGGLEPEQKPAESIFQKALTLADCAPSEAIHVGDSVSADVMGANRCGITSIWVQHGQTAPEQSHEQPAFTVASPAELPELINRLLRHTD